ncbi:MAG: phosphotransferase, partial [Chloroflexota bacterium]
KIKKPVDLGYLDYTTLEKRRFLCQREVELNRRLCPDTYLDVVPVIKRRAGFRLGGRGKAIEYTVKMRRLPQDKMLNVLLANNQVSPEMITQVAQKLAEFHQKAETSAAISSFGDLDTVTRNTKENFDQTLKYIGITISQRQFRRIKAYTEAFLKDYRPLFFKRIADGRIRDCHGDLHAAHICFTDGICIYDCIEFNDRFRYGDVAAEVAFLAMDLDHYGRADLSRTFVQAYLTYSQDEKLLQLLNFYKCYRAYVRGKVESFKFDDLYFSPEEKGEISNFARKYFELAESYIGEQGAAQP